MNGRLIKLSFNDDLTAEVTRGARALVVCPDLRGQAYDLDAEARLEEICGLALAIEIVVAERQIIPIRKIRPSTLFGEGQLDNISSNCALAEAELVIVDGALSPIQQRNLEEKLKLKVIDRTGLILEIFGERAATAEGRLQVELAHLDYQQSRLVRSWTHLERQRGGFGFLGGPGETQIEADRRMIRQRMGRLRKELEQLRKTRRLHRERRGRAPWPVIALVGYTNAGKSTLFNRMTGADVMAEDLLFATLDPTMRAIRLPTLDKVILSDTVGFISDLPTQLVAAFRATLEEVTAADVIVHVRDISSPARTAQKTQVLKVLEELGVASEAVEGPVEGVATEGVAVPEELHGMVLAGESTKKVEEFAGEDGELTGEDVELAGEAREQMFQGNGQGGEPVMEPQSGDVHLRETVQAYDSIQPEELDESTIPIIEAWNKIDLLDQELRDTLTQLAARDENILLLSAGSGEGVEALSARLDSLLTQGAREHRIMVRVDEGRKLAWLHAHGQVLTQEVEEDAQGEPVQIVHVRLTSKDFGRFQSL